MLVTFNTGLLQNMPRCLFDNVAFVGATPMPAEEFEKILDELKASRDLCREVYTGLFPAASAGTAAASRLADLDAFIEYAMVAQETASMNLSEAPTATKQSLRGRFIDLLLPETWEHFAETVTGPTLETPPHF